MRSVMTIFALGCGSSPSPGPPAVAADEVATPTEVALPHQAHAPPPRTTAVSFPRTCEAIARDLESLRSQFPQLASYRAADQKSECHISFKHDTKPPSGRGGGYSAGIPRPNANGIFLYVGIWDPNNLRDAWQLDTQPMTGNWWIGDRRVTVLVDEGGKVKPAAGAIRALLERHGMQLRD